jgi:hypothetical protein
MCIFHRRTRDSLASKCFTVLDRSGLEQFERPLSSLDILLSYPVKPGLVAISF